MRFALPLVFFVCLTSLMAMYLQSGEVGWAAFYAVLAVVSAANAAYNMARS